MSEMLANQFFIARKYAAAAEKLEEALLRDPSNKAMRKKIIICLNEVGRIRRALTFFISLIKEDAGYIINTDPIADDCPCPDLIYQAERHLDNNSESIDFTLRLAMLWLYCDVNQAMSYFEKAHNVAPDDTDIRTALTLLKKKTKQPLAH